MTGQVMDELMARRVTAGAQWLSGEGSRPRWPLLLDPGSLSMTSTCLCVLGQLYGNYWDCPMLLDMDEDEFEDWAIEHGFQIDIHLIPNAGQSAHYGALREAWIAEILRRRADTGTPIDVNG